MNAGIVVAYVATMVCVSAAEAATDPFQSHEISEATYAQVVKAREARVGGNPGIAVTHEATEQET